MVACRPSFLLVLPELGFIVAAEVADAFMELLELDERERLDWE
jgi:hypothetical protein